jgi:hypothetical protein
MPGFWRPLESGRLLSGSRCSRHSYFRTFPQAAGAVRLSLGAADAGVQVRTPQGLSDPSQSATYCIAAAATVYPRNP